jgi:DNA polymerase
MPAPFVLIDFETASACDLKKAGAWRYAEDVTTEILCLGYVTDNGEPTVLKPDDLLAKDEWFMQFVVNPEVMFVAHNVAFEKAIWRNLMIPLGWPDIPNDRWHDTQAVAAMKGLPLKLERAAMALGLQHRKDTEGTRETLALGRVNRRGYYERTPERLARVYQYNASDCVAELELHRRVRGLGTEERRVWLLDQAINERGVRLDMGFVESAQKICDAAALPLKQEFEQLTGLVKVASPKFKDWIVARGVKIDNMQKATIAKLLGEDDEDEESLAGEAAEDSDSEAGLLQSLPNDCRRALEIRSILGSASIKKLGAMRACCGSDGRARGLLQYHGAGPGRWAGRLLQPQNFPRPTLKISGEAHDPDQLVQAILTQDTEYVRLLFGEPISAVANGLRHALIAAGDHAFEVGDFATIEARIVLAIAGQHDATAIMAAGKDVYVDMAQRIYKCPVDKKRDPEKRQTGKNTVLGCGFQMGWRKFKSRYAPNDTDEFAQDCIRAYREDFAPKVPKLWYGLEQAAVRAVWDRRPVEAYGILYQLEDGWLTCRLPSGRKLWYYDPRPVKKVMPWDQDDIRPGFEYSAWKMGQWKRISAYGGLLTENVVQATARDLMVHGMFNAERENHPVILTVHDEIVTEVPAARADAKLLESYMTDIPGWARDLQIPVAAECNVMERYRK